MQDKGYAYIIPDAQGTKHIWVIQGPGDGPFKWVDVGAAGVGIKGDNGTDGIGLNTLTNTDLTYGNVTVTYNTTDGIGINGTMRQTYDGTNHDSTVDMHIPLIPGNGILIDKQAGTEKVEVKVDTTVVKKIYRHLINMKTSTNTAMLILLSSSSAKITFDNLAQNTKGAWTRFIFGTVSKSTGDYAVEKVHGWKDQHTTEVYLDPVVPSIDGSDSVIFADPTTFTDQVIAL